MELTKIDVNIKKQDPPIHKLFDFLPKLLDATIMFSETRSAVVIAATGVIDL